jgi:two-component system chemotaxis response regulator CheB
MIRRPVRVVIVDDSSTMRSLIAASLRRDPGIEVVGQASDAREARAAIKALDPDVVTLDVEMPQMSGLDLLEKIMRLRPMPVVMVSTLTAAGTETTLQALELGAVDCVAKPDTSGHVSGGGASGFESLAERVKVAATARVRAIGDRSTPPARAAEIQDDGRIVAIGSSTGGVEALITLLSEFPKNCPPTVITQHMPPTFTKSFAARLDRLCAPAVAEAHDGAPLKRGQVWLAPGGENHLTVLGDGELRCRLRASGLVNGHRPSVDVLFSSLVKAGAAKRTIGVILTGMGRDGAEGLLALRQAGAHTLGQDEQTCVVYGMPKAAREIGAVEQELPLHRLATSILAQRHAGSHAA